MDKIEAYEHICKTIESCSNYNQESTIDRMIFNFYDMYEDKELYNKLIKKKKEKFI